jgi:hypothetical protein
VICPPSYAPVRRDVGFCPARRLGRATIGLVASTVLMLALCSLGLSGCSGTVSSSTSKRPEWPPQLRVVRQIPAVTDVVSQGNGGRVVCLVENNADVRQAYGLSSWDATPAVLIAGSIDLRWLSACDHGVYAGSADKTWSAPWGGSFESTLASLAAAQVTPSPLGRRLVVDFGRLPSDTARNPYPEIIDLAVPRREIPWSAGPNLSAGVYWLDDDSFLFVDQAYGTPPGSVKIARVSTVGAISIEDTGLRGSCPAASPDGSLWTYLDADRRLVLYDPKAKRRVATWSPPIASEMDFPTSPPAWTDNSHVLFAAAFSTSEPYSMLWVLDVSGVRAR